MSDVKIVTDSAAELSSQVIDEYDITVLPWRVHLDSETHIDSERLRTKEFYRDLVKQRGNISVDPPEVEQFRREYSRLARQTDEIVSIHSSGDLTRVVSIAQRARRDFVGRCTLEVVDSQFMSLALGLLVEEAAKAAHAGLDAEHIVRQVHGMISRVYLAFYVNRAEPLLARDLVSRTSFRTRRNRNYKPILLLEDGEILPLQRSRRRGKPNDRLIEFISEFIDLEQLYFITTGLAPGLEEFRTLYAEDLPNQPIKEHIYGPVFVAHVGLGALGVVAVESGLI